MIELIYFARDDFMLCLDTVLASNFPAHCELFATYFTNPD